MYAILPANRTDDGEDVEVFADEARAAPTHKFCMLRQQAEGETSTYLSQADFVAPKGVKDYLGMFAVACHGCDVHAAAYEAANDDYSKILMQALADRLVEAVAEILHKDMRVAHWGYAAGESLTPEDMLKVKYQGIRPAPGYPTQPDHTEKNFMWKLLDAEKATGIQLTDSLAMLPAASVSALVFANDCSTYFQVGKVCKDQMVDYAARKSMSLEEVEKWMGPYLGYDNSK